jgi:hypothetical protein
MKTNKLEAIIHFNFSTGLASHGTVFESRESQLPDYGELLWGKGSH